MISAPGALAQNSTADIHSAGPLTDIFISSDTECQVGHTGDVDANGNPQFEFFPPSSTTGVSCGTDVSIAGQLFGPQWIDRLDRAAPVRGHRLAAPRRIRSR